MNRARKRQKGPQKTAVSTRLLIERRRRRITNAAHGAKQEQCVLFQNDCVLAVDSRTKTAEMRRSHASRRDGGVVTQRTANPCTRVRFPVRPPSRRDAALKRGANRTVRAPFVSAADPNQTGAVIHPIAPAAPKAATPKAIARATLAFLFRKYRRFMISPPSRPMVATTSFDTQGE